MLVGPPERPSPLLVGRAQRAELALPSAYAAVVALGEVASEWSPPPTPEPLAAVLRVCRGICSRGPFRRCRRALVAGGGRPFGVRCVVEWRAPLLAGRSRTGAGCGSTTMGDSSVRCVAAVS